MMKRVVFLGLLVIAHSAQAFWPFTASPERDLSRKYSSYRECKQAVDDWIETNEIQVIDEDLEGRLHKICADNPMTPMDRCERWRTSDWKWGQNVTCREDLASKGMVLYHRSNSHIPNKDPEVIITSYCGVMGAGSDCIEGESF